MYRYVVYKNVYEKSQWARYKCLKYVNVHVTCHVLMPQLHNVNLTVNFFSSSEGISIILMGSFSALAPKEV